jgi:hypothetical protein
MDKMSIIWVEDNKTKLVHAAFFGKAFTFCKEEFVQEMKFKSIHDFSYYEKCPNCISMVNKIYQGIM